MSARINYPGEICSAIYDTIAACPAAFDSGWKFLFAACVFALLLSTFFREKWESSGIQNSRLNWLVSDKLFILIACLGIFLFRLPNLILPEQCYDESGWIINAAAYNQNSVLWKDVDGGTSGPLVFLPLKALFLLGDGLNFANIRLFGLLVCVIPTLLLTWKTLLLLCGSTAARLIILPLFILFASASHYDLIAYNSEHVPMLLLTICTYLLFLLFYSEQYLTSKLFLLGFILGMIPFSKLQAIPFAVCIGCIALYNLLSSEKSVKEKIAPTVVLVCSSLIGTGIVLLYLVLNDGLDDFWLKYFQMNWTYAKSGAIGGQPPLTGWSRLLLLPYFILRTHNQVNDILPFVATALALVSVAVFFTIKKINLSVFNNRKCIQAFIIVVFASFSVVAPGNRFLHYIILFLVPFLIFMGVVFGEILSRAKQNENSTFMLSVCLLVGVAALFAVSKPNRGIEYAASGVGYPLREESQIIRSYACSNEKMTVWGSAFYYYVETGLLPASSGTNVYFAMALPKEGNPFMDKFISEFKLNKPVVFFDFVYARGFLFQEEKFKHENFPELNKIIKKNYTQVADIDGKRIFVLNSRLEEKGK